MNDSAILFLSVRIACQSLLYGQAAIKDFSFPSPSQLLAFLWVKNDKDKRQGVSNIVFSLSWFLAVRIDNNQILGLKVHSYKNLAFPFPSSLLQILELLL